MCNRWNQGGDEQEQSVHQWALPTVRMCVQRLNTTEGGNGEYFTTCVYTCYFCVLSFSEICGSYIQKHLFFISSEMVIVFKATKSGTPALIINQAFIFSFM